MADSKPGDTVQTSTSGKILPNICLAIMALIPVVIGSFLSAQKKNNRSLFSALPRFNITVKMAATFAFIAGTALFGQYMIIKGFDTLYIVMYFILIGLTAIVISGCRFNFMEIFANPRYHLTLTRGYTTPQTLINMNYSKVKLFFLQLIVYFVSLIWLDASDSLIVYLVSWCTFRGSLIMGRSTSPLINKLLPRAFPNAEYSLLVTRHNGPDSQEDIIDSKFDRKDLLTFALNAVVIIWYAVKRHWVANNVIGMAIAATYIDILQLTSAGAGCILLGLLLLLIYDVFFVFYTDVMITVAMELANNIPALLKFPNLENGMNAATKFNMIGLADLVVPGIFLALLYRFDKSLDRLKRPVYFYSGVLGYIAGLLTAHVVLLVFQHSQPALLYLVPCCVLTPLAVAFVKGDISLLFRFRSDDGKHAWTEDIEKDPKED